MRLIITILSGTRAGQRIPLGPHEALCVGRTSQAAISIADDPTMSAMHYEVRCSEEEATLHDLKSRNGLFVNGQQIAEAVLHDGDQIRAGRTFFSVAISSANTGSAAPGGGEIADDETRATGLSDATRAEAARLMPPDAAPRSPQGTIYWPTDGSSPWLAPEDDSTLDGSLERHLFQQPPQFAAAPQGRLYAVVDGAIAQSLVQEAKRGSLRTECLLGTGSSPYLAAVAPYLIEVAADGDFLALWRTTLDKGPGILLESQAGFEDVLVHARGLFCRKDDRGKPSFFRFYDPKFVYSWLSSCSPSQLGDFFGCLGGVIVGIEGGSRLLRLTQSGDELNAEEVFAH